MDSASNSNMSSLFLLQKRAIRIISYCNRRTRTTSSVARGAGGLELPHWLVKYAKSYVFGAFEAEFSSKIENSPPHRNTAPPLTFEIPISAEKSVSKSVKTFFFFFFWRPPDFGWKKRWNFRAFREIPS